MFPEAGGAPWGAAVGAEALEERAPLLPPASGQLVQGFPGKARAAVGHLVTSAFEAWAGRPRALLVWTRQGRGLGLVGPPGVRCLAPHAWGFASGGTSVARPRLRGLSFHLGSRQSGGFQNINFRIIFKFLWKHC